MREYKYKVEDKVKVDPNGETWTILTVAPVGIPYDYEAVSENGHREYLFEHEVKQVQAKKDCISLGMPTQERDDHDMLKKPAFKIGDKVEAVEGIHYKHTGTVIDFRGHLPIHYVVCLDNAEYCFKESELRLAEGENTQQEETSNKNVYVVNSDYIVPFFVLANTCQEAEDIYREYSDKLDAPAKNVLAYPLEKMECLSMEKVENYQIKARPAKVENV